MKKLLLLTGVLVLLLVAPALATNTPQDPCQHNPTTLCGGEPGPPGPPGPPGAPGEPGAPGLPGADGKDGATGATGAAGATGATGATGAAGAAGVTTIITRVERATCTSRRDYSFRVRKTFGGKRIIGVRASEPGIDVKVSKKAGRFIVSFSTKGIVYPAGGVLRTITVRAELPGRKMVRLVWLYRPCVARDGNPNDPSAAGQGAGEKGEPVRATIR